MNENKQNTTLLTVIAVATLLVAVVGSTFAYFTAQSTSGSTSAVEVTGGKMTLAIDGTNAWIPVDDFEPDTDTPFATKDFTITADYDTKLNVPFIIRFQYESTFVNNMYALLTDKTTDKTGYELTNNFSTYNYVDDNTITSKLVKDSDKDYVTLATGQFLANNPGTKTLTFNLALYFPDNGKNQDLDKQKTFTGHLILATDKATE